MLHADGIRKPESPLLDGSGKSEPRIPVAQVNALLNVDAGTGVGRSEAPAIVTIRGLQAQNAGAGVRVSGANPARLDFGRSRGVHVETRCQRAIDRVSN